MAQFRKSVYSNKSVLCERLANQIAGVLARAGVDGVYIDHSHQSASTYVIFNAKPITFTCIDGSVAHDWETVKIRVSDHSDKYCSSDHYVWARQAAGKEWLAETAKIILQYFPDRSLAKRDAAALAKVTA